MAGSASSSFSLGSSVTIGDRTSPVLFCGPCVIESREHALDHAAQIKEIAGRAGIQFVFKSSYDKANRTSISSFRGLGIDEGLSVLAEVKERLGVPVITDVHSPQEAQAAAEVVDVLQIPAFLCRQTDLLQAAAASGKAVLIKKGQFVAPADMKFVAQKVVESGNSRVMICERGASFGYRELIVDFRGLEIMAETAKCPIVFDGTHSVQIMGGAAGVSGGSRERIPALVRAAAAVGVDGFFLESHENPDSAPSDGANMLPLSELENLLADIVTLSKLQLRTR
ncbi:MAG: 3-deoxy-8-phosphooctulonate synthase [Bdellovibrionales bacterium]|nr:3-deoxy-8-phosphooctulonate synthase [Bdellovibrionales bacterium]